MHEAEDRRAAALRVLAEWNRKSSRWRRRWAPEGHPQPAAGARAAGITGNRPHMHGSTYILGGYQTDFAKAWSREGQDISDMTREATLGALANCALDAAQIAAHPRRQRLRRGAARRPISAPWWRRWCRNCGACRRCATRAPAPRVARDAGGDGRDRGRPLRLRAGARRRGVEEPAGRRSPRQPERRRLGRATKDTRPRSCGRGCSACSAQEYERRYGLDRAT